jgi:hypothetical protein
MKPLNPWLESTLKKAAHLCQDADHVSHSARLFRSTIRRVHELATVGAHRAPEPELERVSTEDGIVLSLEWHDRSSAWHLYLAVARKFGEKPRVMLDFSGNPTSYGKEKPTDEEIAQALSDYFEKWKRDP